MPGLIEAASIAIVQDRQIWHQCLTHLKKIQKKINKKNVLNEYVNDGSFIDDISSDAFQIRIVLVRKGLILS